MAQHEEQLREFISVTNVDEARARFFLESASWNLQDALATYFEDPGEEGDVTPPPQLERVSLVSQPTGVGGGGGGGGRSGGGVRHRVMTFSDLSGHSSSSPHWGAGEEESGEEEGQRFYTGGSEQVIGPPRKKSADEIGRELYRGFKEQGAVPLAAAEPAERTRAAFAGSGYKLGASAEEYAAERHQSSSVVQPPPHVHVVLNMWRTGFSVDDGELRRYDDPANNAFLQDVRNNRIPAELTYLARGGEVLLTIEDRRAEAYVRTKPSFRAFSGEGQQLGSAGVAAATVPSYSGSAWRGGAASARRDEQEAADEAKASASVTLDPSQPVTCIQIRLADGGRLVQRFNHTHRVADARRFVLDARPAMAGREFVLMTSYPSQVLTDESLTLLDANLLNAVIIQKLK